MFVCLLECGSSQAASGLVSGAAWCASEGGIDCMSDGTESLATTACTDLKTVMRVRRRRCGRWMCPLYSDRLGCLMCLSLWRRHRPGLMVVTDGIQRVIRRIHPPATAGGKVSILVRVTRSRSWTELQHHMLPPSHPQAPLLPVSNASNSCAWHYRQQPAFLLPCKPLNLFLCRRCRIGTVWAKSPVRCEAFRVLKSALWPSVLLGTPACSGDRLSRLLWRCCGPCNTLQLDDMC